MNTKFMLRKSCSLFCKRRQSKLLIVNTMTSKFSSFYLKPPLEFASKTYATLQQEVLKPTSVTVPTCLVLSIVTPLILDLLEKTLNYFRCVQYRKG